MNRIFYEEWTNNRLNKIISIFGKNWFYGKKILDMGCGDGSLGISLLKLGSEVYFSDVRHEHLENISNDLRSKNYTPNCYVMDCNEDFELNQKFDMILNFGLIYNLQNWRKNLFNTMKHSNLVLLESKVVPNVDYEESFHFSENYHEYCGHKGEMSSFRQEDVENELTKLGCKFLRIDDPCLNVNSWDNSELRIRFIYDWHENNSTINNSHVENLHYHRFWIVLK